LFWWETIVEHGCEAWPENHQAELEDQLAQIQAELDAVREQSEAQKSWSRGFAKIVGLCAVSNVGQLGKKASERVACVMREWRGSVETVMALGMYKRSLCSVAVGGTMTAVCTASSLPLGMWHRA